MKLNTVGVSEVRWTGLGSCIKKGTVFYHSEIDIHEYGVGILANKLLGKAVTTDYSQHRTTSLMSMLQ